MLAHKFQNSFLKCIILTFLSRPHIIWSNRHIKSAKGKSNNPTSSLFFLVDCIRPTRSILHIWLKQIRRTWYVMHPRNIKSPFCEIPKRNPLSNQYQIKALKNFLCKCFIDMLEGSRSDCIKNRLFPEQLCSPHFKTINQKSVMPHMLRIIAPHITGNINDQITIFDCC